MNSEYRTGCLWSLAAILAMYGLWGIANQSIRVPNRRGPNVVYRGSAAVWFGVAMMLAAGAAVLVAHWPEDERRSPFKKICGVAIAVLFFGTCFVSCSIHNQQVRERREKRHQDWLNSPEVKELREHPEKLEKWLDEVKKNPPAAKKPKLSSPADRP